MTLDELIEQAKELKRVYGGSLRVNARNPAGDNDEADRLVIARGHNGAIEVEVARDCDRV